MSTNYHPQCLMFSGEDKDRERSQQAKRSPGLQLYHGWGRQGRPSTQLHGSNKNGTTVTYKHIQQHYKCYRMSLYNRLNVSCDATKQSIWQYNVRNAVDTGRLTLL